VHEAQLVENPPMRPFPSRLHRTVAPGVAAAIALAIAALAALVACTTGQKKQAAESAFDVMSERDQLETFEAIARMLDEHPERVDAMYAVVRRHAPMMNRFLDNAATDLEDPDLAWRAAVRVAAHPDSLVQALRATTDAVAKRPEARAAINRGIRDRAETMTDILTDEEATLGRVIEVSLRVLAKKPAARRGVLTAVSQHRAEILAFVKQDEPLAKAMTKELVSEAVKDKPLLQKVLKSLDVAE
jgi:hypothetical protein